MDKIDLVNQYRAERKLIISDKSLSIKERDEAVLALSEGYLEQHPELNDRDCSGRGMPAHEANKAREFLGGMADGGRSIT